MPIGIFLSIIWTPKGQHWANEEEVASPNP